MPILDFKEISRANDADGNQDTFELFARDFLEMMRLDILRPPDRGQDGGRDLIVQEQREGVIDTTKFNWLVSCKHKAHSGESVGTADDNNILDRLKLHECDGFMGFYSTLPSSGLTRSLGGLGKPYKIFDRELIETMLLKTSEGHLIAKRYFPVSYATWEAENPANILPAYLPLPCANCNIDLLEQKSGNIVFVKDNSSGVNKIVAVYNTCSGNECDLLNEQLYTKHGFVTAFESLEDITIPSRYLEWVTVTLEKLHKKEYEFEYSAFESLKISLTSLAQFVYRHETYLQQQKKALLKALSL